MKITLVFIILQSFTGSKLHQTVEYRVNGFSGLSECEIVLSRLELAYNKPDVKIIASDCIESGSI